MERILPTILATLTRVPRHKVDTLKWCDTPSWTYNVFRVWEMVMWRRSSSQNPNDTIRIESSTAVRNDNGKITVVRKFYTWEALFMWVEHCVRQFFTVPDFGFRFVPIPQLQVVNGPKVPLLSPIFSFAIAWDYSASANIPTAGTTSVTQINSSSNPFLMTYANDSSGDNVDSVTYAAVSMTQTNKGLRGDGREAYLYTLNAPATGSNTLSVHSTGAPGALYNISNSYSGAAQSGQPDSSNFAIVNTSSSPSTTSTTVVAANCWTAACYDNTSGAVTSTTVSGSATHRADVGLGFNFWNDSNGTVATGTQSKVINFTGTLASYVTLLSIAPFVSPVTVSPRINLPLLGVG